MLVFLAFVLPLLASCGQIELYSGLTEQEANEMLAVLNRHGITSTKVPQKEGLVALSVPSEVVAHAIEILRSVGLPREKFVRMGDIFKKEGLISSPMEERVRYLFGLEQEIAGTLAKIDGVIAARVNIVLPEAGRAGQPSNPSSAAVFLKVRKDTDLEPMIPQIKVLVTNSVEGLVYEKVTVVLFPTVIDIPEVEAPPLKTLLGIRIDPASEDNLWLVVGTLGGLLVLALIGIGVVVFLMLTRHPSPAPADRGDD